MHLPVAVTIYLHYDDVFVLDINLLRFVPPAIGQTIARLPIPMIRLIFLMYKSFLPENHNKFLAVLCCCLFVFVCLLVCGAPKMNSSILFHII